MSQWHSWCGSKGKHHTRESHLENVCGDAWAALSAGAIGGSQTPACWDPAGREHRLPRGSAGAPSGQGHLSSSFPVSLALWGVLLMLLLAARECVLHFV